MPTLLSTKILNSAQQQSLLNAGFKLSQYDAIQIIPVDFEMPEKIENVIFTSQNAVKRIQNSEFRTRLSDGKVQNCFCVGKKTKALLETKGGKIIGWAEYGKDLAHLIIDTFRNEKFVFFCGNLRREELPILLKKNKVDFKEICIYKTELNPKKFQQDFDGVLFYSPSGVESFCQQNNLENSIAFCIGTTTAAEAEKHTNKIVIAEEPTVESVIRSCCKVSKTL